MALVTLVYANIAISWQLLRFNVLKNIFLRFIGLKGLKMVWEKSSLIWNFFPWLWLKNLFFPDFSDWKKSSKFSLNSLISLIGGNPDSIASKTLNAHILLLDSRPTLFSHFVFAPNRFLCKRWKWPKMHKKLNFHSTDRSPFPVYPHSQHSRRKSFHKKRFEQIEKKLSFKL